MDKRKLNQTDSSTWNVGKKLRMDNSKGNGKFTEDCIPDGIFPIGGDVFVMVSTYYDTVSVHIRRYKKYGKTYYPSAEGITLVPWWIEHIMGRNKVPESRKELPRGLFPPEHHIQITSENFTEFIFKRIKYGLDEKPTFKEIIITRDQWSEMIKNYSAIENVVIDKRFQCMDFLTAFKSFCENSIEKTLPPTVDNTLGQDYLTKILKNSICSLFYEKGLKEPKTFGEELFGNKVETFNSFALSFEANEIAERFYDNLFENEKFLLLKPINYVTEEFITNLQLDRILQEVRDMLCPPDCFEYYEDFSQNLF